MSSAVPAGSRAVPRRIVVVEFLPSGGMFQFGFQFADALARAGHDVELLTGPAPELRSTHPRLRVIESLPTWHPNALLGTSGLRQRARRGWRALLLLESWRRVRAHVRRVRPDIVQFGELRYAVDSIGFVLVARLGAARRLVDVAHNPVPYDVHAAGSSVEKRGRFTRSLLARAYRAADVLLVLGEGPKHDLARAFPDAPEAAVVGHGDYGGVLATAAVPAPSEAGPTALFFGAWTKYKNLPMLLEAFALVRERLPQARLTIAGPAMPDVDVDEILARAAAIGNIDARPDYVPLEAVPELFSTHRAVLFPYSTVNISGSVHMAYTFGRAVIATDVGAMRDAVVDGVTGLLTEPSAQRLAATILRILEDDALADRLGAGSSRHAGDGSSWDQVVERAVAAYGDSAAFGAQPTAKAAG